MIIGLIGKKQSGKDSIFNCLFTLWNERRINLRPYRLAFADEVYKEVAAEKGIEVAKLRELRNTEPEIRKALQEHGSNKRKLDPFYWISKLVPLADDSKLQIITDCRFKNEAEWIIMRGGKLCRVRREISDSSDDNHESEKELEGIRSYSYIINNDYSKERLKFMALDMIKSLVPNI